MESRLAEVVDKTVIMEVDAELSLCSCESDVVDETCSLGGDDTRGVRRVDVTGGEINNGKSAGNKGFPGVGVVLTAVLIPGFFTW